MQENKGKRGGEVITGNANNTAAIPPSPDPVNNDQHFQVVEDQIDDIPDPTTSMTLEQYFEKMKVNKKKSLMRAHQ